nr:MAG TPA: hypothetical protein [Caudoviricetes sp.]
MGQYHFRYIIFNRRYFKVISTSSVVFITYSNECT